jgi:hypothetical protein
LRIAVNSFNSGRPHKRVRYGVDAAVRHYFRNSFGMAQRQRVPDISNLNLQSGVDSLNKADRHAGDYRPDLEKKRT